MTDIERLSQLESQKAITVGLHRNAANNFWSSTSFIGKILNLGTIVFLVFAVYVFYGWGWKISSLALVGLLFYVQTIQWLCFASVRIHMLRDQELFELFYKAGAATVRVNATGEIIRYPEDWRRVLP